MTDTVRTGLAATFSLRAVSRAAFGCVLGAALLATGIPARAGDDDDTPIDTKILRSILEGLGLRKDGECGDQLRGARAAGDPAEPRFAAAGKFRRRDRQKSGLAERSGRAARRKKEAAQERNRRHHRMRR